MGYIKPYPELKSILSELQADIEAIEKDTSLCDETNFTRRAAIVDDIEFHIIDRIDGILQTAGTVEELINLKQYAEKVRSKFEEIDNRLFQRLRERIKTGDYIGATFRNMIEAYTGDYLSSGLGQTEPGYDHLDAFTNGLLPIQTIPNAIKEKEPEMVFYQKTPARVIFELVDKAHFSKGDVFYDLGSGLGHVPVLVNLLSGVHTKGVEFEPAYSDYAAACAAELNLPGVQFINADARMTDYSDGTVFFMYTPFEGSILKDVLEMLRLESLKRNIRVLTYGPCTFEVEVQSWLNREDRGACDIYKLGVFRSS